MFYQEDNFTYSEYLISIYEVYVTERILTMGKITSIVQSGETLSLYASMYNCSVEDLKKANAGNLDKNGGLKTGTKINIPIGQKPARLAKNNDEKMQKLNAFDNRLNELHMQLFNEKLKPDVREKLEQRYIELKNLKKERSQVATFSISAEGDKFDLKLKKTITVAEFRRLFPECTTNFLGKAKEGPYINGKGHNHDPKVATLEAGKTYSVRYNEYERHTGQGWFDSALEKLGLYSKL